MRNKPKKLLDHVRDILRLKHYACATEKSYLAWVRKYILFHQKRHPKEMGKTEIEAYLTHLAIDQHVSPGTQNPCTELAEVRPSAPSCSCIKTSCSRTRLHQSPVG